MMKWNCNNKLHGKDDVMKSLPADNIYQRLCDLRNGTGKSQKEVADELNVEKQNQSVMIWL